MSGSKVVNFSTVKQMSPTIVTMAVSKGVVTDPLLGENFKLFHAYWLGVINYVPLYVFGARRGSQ